jgi:hypothetical protein
MKTEYRSRNVGLVPLVTAFPRICAVGTWFMRYRVRRIAARKNVFEYDPERKPTFSPLKTWRVKYKSLSQSVSAGSSIISHSCGLSIDACI